jgi:predicted TIM-barrel fold metal-dependent hydrolase
MLSLTDKEVEFIATQLLKGNVCFYQVDKKKIHHLPDDEDHFNYDLTEEEEDILDEIEEQPDNFAEFTRLEPAEEHQLMQDFVDRRVKERTLAEDLVSALSNPKASTAFQFLLEGTSYKEEWSEFLRGKYYDWIKEQVDAFNYAED